MTLDDLKKQCKKHRYSDAQLSAFFDGYSKANKDYQQGRADAIDEFVKLLKEEYPIAEYPYDNGIYKNELLHDDIDDIAEQLKEKE